MLYGSDCSCKGVEALVGSKYAIYICTKKTSVNKHEEAVVLIITQ